ncbi:TetR/AcrR family transcriptional regulator [Streptomyces sp. NPDC059740]|uniref:TetR/AcrR family transcriptional regulator n=1 Tax=Streptomyces sp. NPDC059740 TaxID=3346926 RepID=UPI003668458C
MPPRRSETVESLLAGAERAFADRGFHGASIGYICQCAGRTTGAFYSNYDSKMKLFLDVYERHTDRTAALIADRLADVDTDGDLARQLADRLTDIVGEGIDERWISLAVEFRLTALRDGAVAAALIEREDRFAEHVGEMLEALFRRAGHRPTLEGHEMVALLVAMTRGISLDRGVRRSGHGPAALRSGTVTTTLEALFAHTGAVAGDR